MHGASFILRRALVSMRSLMNSSTTLVVLAVLAGMTAVLTAQAWGRNRRWGLLVSIPSLVFPAWLAWVLFAPWRVTAAGSDAGFVTMEQGWTVVFAPIALAPFAILASTALFFYPRQVARNLGGALGGAVLAAGLIFGVHRFGTESWEVAVIDQEGAPARDLKVDLHRFTSGSSATKSSLTTDAHGVVRFRVSRYLDWALRVTTSDGTLNAVSRGRPDGGPKTPKVWSWFCHHASWDNFESRTTKPSAPDSPKRAVLRLRNRSDAVSPWVVQELETLIETFRRGGPGATELAVRARSTELFAILPKVLEAIRKRPVVATDAHEIARVLDSIGIRLVQLHSTLGGDTSSPEGANKLFLPRQVLSYDRTLGRFASASDLRQRVVELAAQLVSASRPYWSECGPCGIGKLQNLRSAHIPELLRFMEEAGPLSRYHEFSFVVERACADPAVLTPFFASTHREVAVAALLGAYQAMPRSAALEVHSRLSRPDERSPAQIDLETIRRELIARTSEAPVR